MVNKTFVFLYPQSEIFNQEIEHGSVFFEDANEEEKYAYFLYKMQSAKTEIEKNALIKEAKKDKADSFKPVYSEKLNSCIHHRYRKNGFSIVYAVLEDCQVSDVIKLHQTDKIIRVGLDSKEHRTKRDDGTYPYPDQDYIINQLIPVDVLRVAGFHMWDCVEKLARRAYERGIDVLVDEDLTELFPWRLKDPNFRVKKYLNANSKNGAQTHFEVLIESRRNKPWLS